LNLSSPSTNLLIYDEQGEGLTNQIAPEFFQNPTAEAGAYFVAEIRVTPNYPRPGISRVQATVDAPASAPPSRRSSFVFVTFMNQRP
jgi:hypothetical protein